MKIVSVCFMLISAIVFCQKNDYTIIKADSGIRVSTTHPQYWMYQGKNILLLGGSVDDNLFQIENLEKHLDLLKSVGGNYVRNTMSCRDEGNLWPFAMNEDGLYDLNKWDEAYWERFAHFLEQTANRDIIVQMEIWATFDFYRDNWVRNPFNPKNNINYDERRSKLPLEVETHPVYTENNFFRTVPSQMNLARPLWYQKKFVDKILSYTLNYGHILYCMDNETSVTSDWGKFWAQYIRKKAGLAGKTVHTTEMWDPHDLDHPMHFETFDNPDVFTFVDISQNNHQSGENQWRNGLKQIEYLTKMDYLRPVNNVKIYGNDGGQHQTTRNGIESFCRNVLFGAASVRFHRPTSGQGLNEIAQHVIKSIRMLTDETDFFNGRPMNTLLSDREENKAYCRAIPGEEYVVYFTDGGEVTVDTSAMSGKVKLRWLPVLEAEWAKETTVTVQNQITLKCPGPGHWIAVLQAF